MTSPSSRRPATSCAAAPSGVRRHWSRRSRRCGHSACSPAPCPRAGPGIRITVEDPEGDLSLNHLLDGIEELRNAGVEAIEINDRVRVIAQTSFEDDPEGVRVDGLVLKAPYVIDAIGNPDTLAGALQFQDGFIDDVERDGGSVTVKRPDRVDVTVTRTPVRPRYAEAVPGQ